MIPATLKELREELNVSQQEMANLLGVIRQTYAKMEANPDTMSIADVSKACRYLCKKLTNNVFLSTVTMNSFFMDDEGQPDVNENVPANGISQGQE
jgi:DNA-binding XRE family transcriptional regulator